MSVDAFCIAFLIASSSDISVFVYAQKSVKLKQDHEVRSAGNLLHATQSFSPLRSDLLGYFAIDQSHLPQPGEFLHMSAILAAFFISCFFSFDSFLGSVLHGKFKFNSSSLIEIDVMRAPLLSMELATILQALVALGRPWNEYDLAKYLISLDHFLGKRPWPPSTSALFGFSRVSVPFGSWIGCGWEEASASLEIQLL